MRELARRRRLPFTLQRCATLVGAVEAQVALANVGSDVNVMMEDVIDFMHDMNSISPAQEAFCSGFAR